MAQLTQGDRVDLGCSGLADTYDPEKARRYRESAKPEKEDTCSMCGNFCAVKNMNRILDGEIVSIFDE